MKDQDREEGMGAWVLVWEDCRLRGRRRYVGEKDRGGTTAGSRLGQGMLSDQGRVANGLQSHEAGTCHGNSPEIRGSSWGQHLPTPS